MLATGSLVMSCWLEVYKSKLDGKIHNSILIQKKDE